LVVFVGELDLNGEGRVRDGFQAKSQGLGVKGDLLASSDFRSDDIHWESLVQAFVSDSDHDLSGQRVSLLVLDANSSDGVDLGLDDVFSVFKFNSDFGFILFFDSKSLLSDESVSYGDSLDLPDSEQIVGRQGKSQGRDSSEGVHIVPLHNDDSSGVFNPHSVDHLLLGLEPSVKGDESDLSDLIGLVDNL
jgi:hypothetical protein